MTKGLREAGESNVGYGGVYLGRGVGNGGDELGEDREEDRI